MSKWFAVAWLLFSGAFVVYWSARDEFLRKLVLAAVGGLFTALSIIALMD